MANLEWFDTNEFQRYDIDDDGMLIAGNDVPMFLLWHGPYTPIRMGKMCKRRERNMERWF